MLAHAFLAVTARTPVALRPPDLTRLSQHWRRLHTGRQNGGAARLPHPPARRYLMTR
jgi:hypothetical protein